MEFLPFSEPNLNIISTYLCWVIFHVISLKNPSLLWIHIINFIQNTKTYAALFIFNRFVCLIPIKCYFPYPNISCYCHTMVIWVDIFQFLTKLPLESSNEYMAELHIINLKKWYEICPRCQQTMGKGESADHYKELKKKNHVYSSLNW